MEQITPRQGHHVVHYQGGPKNGIEEELFILPGIIECHQPRSEICSEDGLRLPLEKIGIYRFVITDGKFYYIWQGWL